MRLLGVAALTMVVALGLLYAAQRDAISAWIGAVEADILLVAAGAALGATVSALTLHVLVRFRLNGLARAAEHIADGDYTVGVRPGSGGIESRFARAINRIAEAMADTHDRATIDRLTGVYNRQAILAELYAEVERASRYDRPLCVAFVDIDHFKVVNDSYGHEAGDVVLRGVAQMMASHLRASDMIGRYGGEEFMLILTETTVEDGASLAEKLRALVERQRFAVDGNPSLSVTISLGIVGGIGEQLRMETLIRDADAAMYSAKALGRNQTYVFEEPDEDSRVPRAPISAAGRARANEIGRVAREAATAALASVVVPLPSHRGQPSAIISSIVMALARQLDLPEAEIERLRMAAILHDIGKVAVPEEILDKPATLTSTEWRTVVQHPRIGQVILEQAAALKDAVPIILHHHERFAGHGYPYGLRANEIPLGARIVAIADAYDAMVNDRPYKRSISHQQAVGELRRHAGTQFDPELVELFCDLYADHAPEPDATILAMAAGNRAHRGAPIVIPDAARTTRKRRQTVEPESSTGAGPIVESQTMAPEGTLGLVPEAGIPVGPRPGTPSRVGRGDTAAG
jgi:diguanylate cyclase (GGDEF)-like protein